MKNEVYTPHQSSIGNINANVMALLCYVTSVVVGFIPLLRYGVWLIPLVIFLIEKQSIFVKFHAMQSFLLYVVSATLTFLISVILGSIWGISSMNATTYYATANIAGIISLPVTVISLVILVFAIIPMVGAYKYKEIHIPIIVKLPNELP